MYFCFGAGCDIGYVCVSSGVPGRFGAPYGSGRRRGQAGSVDQCVPGRSSEFLSLLNQTQQLNLTHWRKSLNCLNIHKWF